MRLNRSAALLPLAAIGLACARVRPVTARITGREQSPCANASAISVRARLVSSDGRVLIARETSAGGLPWLVDSAVVGKDSSYFNVKLGVDSASSKIVITDWRGRCFGPIGRESSIALVFNTCNREPLFVDPAAYDKIATGSVEFTLRTRFGRVGPTAVSPLLVPRSPLVISFRLEPRPTV